MKRILVFCAGGHGAQEAIQLEEAIEQSKKGNEVYLLSCDESIGICNSNKNALKIQCKLCKYLHNCNKRTYLSKEIKQISIKDFITEEIKKTASVKFKYENIEELRNIEFEGIQIGLGAVSSYITYTRNLNPEFNTDFKNYIDKLLSSQVIITLILGKIQEVYNFDSFIFYNGRFSLFKPFLNFAQKKDIDYICTECSIDNKGNIVKNYFYNNIPHSIEAFTEKILTTWRNAKDNGLNCEEIGKSFFERRKHSQGTGDKIYTVNQDDHSFISEWRKDKENIVIFNSSEDEFSAVGGDFEKNRVFSSQMEGIKTIIEHYKNDTKKHFYLRVHPNLSHIDYSYHQNLYKLDYPNLTVIPANSSISTYKLLDNADKVITFGSTMGIEASYAHKPSICIGPSLYDRLNVAYHPKSIGEVWEKIENTVLKEKYNENVLAYGFYIMSRYDHSLHKNLKYIDGKQISKNIFGKKRLLFEYNKIWGSKRLYLLVRFFMNKYCNKEIPSKENINH